MILSNHRSSNKCNIVQKTLSAKYRKNKQKPFYRSHFTNYITKMKETYQCLFQFIWTKQYDWKQRRKHKTYQIKFGRTMLYLCSSIWPISLGWPQSVYKWIFGWPYTIFFCIDQKSNMAASKCRHLPLSFPFNLK